MSRAKVLVADDVLEIREMLRYVLQTRYDVVMARNGEEAWELFNAEKPDIVLSDLVMPRIKGDELCALIKNSFAPDTPVVLITAATRDKELADGFWKKAAGTDGFISKPFSPTQVLEVVERLLGRRHTETGPSA